MVVFGEHLEDRAGDLQPPLDGLVGVRVGAHGDGARHVARARELAGEQLRGVRLGEQPGLEVEPGREAEPGVGRAGEAVHAAMLAAAIGVDRAIERNIGRVVPRDDAPRPVERHRRVEAGRGGFRAVLGVPAVVRPAGPQTLEAAAAVGHGAASRARPVGQRRGARLVKFRRRLRRGPCRAGIDHLVHVSEHRS